MRADVGLSRTVLPLGLSAVMVLAAHAAPAQSVNDFDRAIQESTRIVESAQSTRIERLDALAARGGLFRKTGQFDLAIVDFTEVLRNRPGADDIYVERGMAYVSTTQSALAMTDFSDALRINPDNRSALNQRASLYRSQGVYDEAIRDLDRSVALDGTDSTFPVRAIPGVLLGRHDIGECQSV